MSNVRSIAWYREEKERRERMEQDLQEDLRKPEAEFDFAEAMRRNTAIKAKKAKERSDNNKNIVRNFRLRKGS